MHFQRLRTWAKTAFARLLGEQARDALVAHLGRARTAVADQERNLMRLAGMMAADVGIDRFKLVDEAVLEQEVERAIYRRRRGTAVLTLEPIEQIVGLDRLRLARDELQHAQAQRRQSQATQLARAHDRADECLRIVVVVMVPMCGMAHGRILTGDRRGAISMKEWREASLPTSRDRDQCA